MLYESHMHTPLCKHATGEPGDYARMAEQRGLKGIIVTCHSPMPDGFAPHVRMGMDEFDTYVAMVEQARHEWDGRVDIRLGMESDYFPGMEGWLEDLHSRAPFHHILGSVHPQLEEYRDRYFNGDWLLFHKTYFNHLADAAETGLFDTLAHPDLVKNVHPPEWEFERLRDHIGLALDRIAGTGIAMELNTSGLNKAIAEMNPGPDLLHEIQRRNIPVVLGADAHLPERVADEYETALRQLQELGLTAVSFFLSRQRQDVPIETALASLRA